MKVLGVVAEYNPLHLGHRWQLSEARRRSGADAVVVALSGCFTQRGAPALCSPADRARMALRCGADAVFLLPAQWVLRDAEHYALGAVWLLHRLGCSCLSFGAEDPSPEALWRVAGLLEQEPEEMRAALHRLLDAGLPYPAALAQAAEQALPGASALLQRPNNTLAVCYLRAIRRLGLEMEVYPVQRRGDHRSGEAAGEAPSAGALRGALLRGSWQTLGRSMPPQSLSLLRAAAEEGRLCRPGSLDALLLWRLRTIGETELNALPQLSEGIQRRLQAEARKARSADELIAGTAGGRYPASRVRRLCAHCLLQLSQAQLEAQPLPDAGWLLGLRREARPLMRYLHQQGFPLIDSAAGLRGDADWLQTELRAFELWALAAGQPAGMAWTQGVAVE